jgi:hypothetical protein
MKHSEFNRYIGDMPCKVITDVFEFKSATTFKAVCWDLARYGHYTTGANIRVSMETLAKECGVNRKTVHKVKDILKHNHLLVKTGTTPGNITIWALGAVVPYEDLRSPFPSTRLSVIEGHNNKEHIKDHILHVSNETLVTNLLTPEEYNKLSDSMSW